jgi:hypothetical protein
MVQSQITPGAPLSDRGSAIGHRPWAIGLAARESAHGSDDACYENSGPKSDCDSHGKEGATSYSDPASLPKVKGVGKTCHDDESADDHHDKGNGLHARTVAQGFDRPGYALMSAAR